ncbi:hypothetical protein GS452_08480 [Rhodococcus hoagii]|nr:hypothetical protein [Prescottella equi]
MMFGRKKKQAAREAALEEEARRQDEFWSRAARVTTGCQAHAFERYRQLPAANSTHSCSKCGETNLSRTFFRTTVAHHRPLCQALKGEAQLLGVSLVGHRRDVFDALAVDCRTCGAEVDVERTVDADIVIRTKEAAARRNGMGIPVHEGGEQA